MQFFWKYIDDLMGKGLSISVINELLFYVSASLIPLALPLAILLSSIMTFGNLAENNELTALKASGLSLYRIIRPLTSAVIVIALFTFYFANYVIPVANLKWHSLIFDIQNTKIASILSPGVYSNELDGYAIKVDEGTDDYFKGILIHDHNTPNQIKSIRAKEGKIYKSENGKYLFFELKNGSVTEELNPKAPSFAPNGDESPNNSSYPSRRSEFDKATYKIDLSGFDLARSQEEMFKDKHEMLNVFQIDQALDSIKKTGKEVIDNFVLNVTQDHAYFHSIKYQETQKVNNSETGVIPMDTLFSFKKLSVENKIKAIQVAQTKLRNKNRNIEGQQTFMNALERDKDSYLIEFNRKFALTAAIIILFFIGAPLGAIVRKGGFGAPVVIAALLFMIYFVLITIGENLATAGSVSPFLGMWFASMVLAPIAIFFMYKAANDAPIFNFDGIKKLFKRSKR